MPRQYNTGVKTKPKDGLLYGTGCDEMVNGERVPFCDDCEKCPFPDCRANGSGTSRYIFSLMHKGSDETDTPKAL